MKRAEWYVTEKDECPAGHKGECFYCKRPVGTPHDEECVTRHRTIVVRVMIEYVTDAPESWDAEMINWHYNESGWCAENISRELGRIAEHSKNCMCCRTHFEYVREATAVDEARDGLYAEDDLGIHPVLSHDNDDDLDDDDGETPDNHNAQD